MTELQAISLAQGIQESKELSRQAIKQLSDEKDAEKEATLAGFIAGYNAAMGEWRKCYLSCSSTYCAERFKTVTASGMLGNMEKAETKED